MTYSLFHVWANVSELVKKVLQATSGLQAAYVMVHFNEIIEQLQKIGGLLYNEADVVNLSVHPCIAALLKI